MTYGIADTYNSGITLNTSQHTITIGTSGTYQVNFALTLYGSTTVGVWTVDVQQNTNDIAESSQVVAVPSGSSFTGSVNFVTVSAAFQYQFSAGDVLRVYATWQSTGTPTVDFASGVFNVVRIA